ncbi:MAG: signal peptidase I [Deltaproteobacteria bacterium]|nr:signal peptidase I [Deltaproteobacteria bacterium]
MKGHSSRSVAKKAKTLKEESRQGGPDAAGGILQRGVDQRRRFFRKAKVMEYARSLGLAVFMALLIRTFIVEPFKIPTGSMIPTLMVHDHIFVSKFKYGLRIPFTHTDIVDFDEPERGDVAVFEFPAEGEDKGKNFIKRVVAVAGDRVRIKDNRLMINGKSVSTKVVERDVPCDDSTHEDCRCVRQKENLNGRWYLTQHMVGSPGSGGSECANNPDWPNDNPLQFGSKGTNEDYPEVRVPKDHVLTIGDNRDNSNDGRFWGFVPVENFKGKALFIWWPPGRWFQRIP